jgi:hypothetical protein
MPELTPLQAAVFEHPAVRSMVVELRDPFGQQLMVETVRPFSFGPDLDEDGAVELPALLDALDVTEIRAPLHIPGTDPRAPHYFLITLDPASRLDRSGIQVEGAGAVSDAP